MSSKFNYFTWGVITGAVISVIIFGITLRTSSNNTDFVPIDTTYNRIVLDSIRYNIVERDSVIYNIRRKIIEDADKVIALDDSSTVKLFLELATSTD